MNANVLCVDDEPMMLAAYRTFLESEFRVETAVGGQEALAFMAESEPFAVVVSDLEMPGMNGIRFLASVRDKYPDTVRMVLTGNANLKNAVQAVNDGYVYRFLTKPCQPDTFQRAIRAGVEQSRLITAQKDLLENTLHGSLHVLGELLAMINPIAFGKSLRVRQIVREMCGVDGKISWELDIASLLCQLGCIDIPSSVLKRAERGESLGDNENQMLLRHPTVGFELLRSIPRMERVAETIASQNQPFSAIQPGTDELSRSRWLKVALDYDTLLQRGELASKSIVVMKSRTGLYDPAALAALENIISRQVPSEATEIPFEELRIGMVIAADVMNSAGVLLLKKGTQITDTLKSRLQTLVAYGSLGGSIIVFYPSPAMSVQTY